MRKLMCAVLIFASVVTNITVGFASNSSMYTQNLFGESFYNCDTAEIGASFTADADNSVSYDNGGTSVKLTGRGRDLFKKKITEDLHGKKAEVSFCLKKEETVTFDTNDILLRYRIYYNNGTSEDKTSFQSVVIGTISNSTEWQRFNMTLEIDNPTITDTYTGIEFYATVNDGTRIQIDGAMWIDQISLKALPDEGELPTTITQAAQIPNSNEQLVNGVLVGFDTNYISENSISEMALTLNDRSFTAYTAAIEALDSTAQIRILFDTPQYLRKLAVTGLKDIWGYDIPGNVLIDIQTPQTTVTAMAIVPNTENDNLADGIIMTLDTDYVSIESLSEMTSRLNSQLFGDYTISVENVDNVANVKILFEAPQIVSKFSVSGLKDVWGCDVSADVSISVETSATYTENLLGEKFTKCEDTSGVTSTFNIAVDNTEAYEGTGSYKFASTGNGSDLITIDFLTDPSDLPEKLNFSFRYKLAEGTYVTGSAPYNYEIPIDRFRIYCRLLCEDEQGNSVVVGPDGTAVINGDPNSTEWQYFKHTITPDYSYVTDGLTMVGIRVSVRPYLGIMCRLNGAIWMDKIVATRIPQDGEYVPEFIGTYPENNMVDAPTDKVVFKFRGSIEEGYLSSNSILINGIKSAVKISKSYDAATDTSSFIIAPLAGFENLTNYTVSLSGIYDIWGRIIDETYSTQFTTIDKFTVSNCFVTVDSNCVETGTALSAESGNIKAKFSIRNNTAEAKSAMLVLAACKEKHIEKFAVSNEILIEPGDTQEISTLINDFDSSDNRYLRAFLWDTVNTHRPLAEIAELR